VTLRTVDLRLTGWPRLAIVAVVLLGFPYAGQAQVDSREGIALQNQIYQLRQDLQVLRSEAAQGGYGGGGGGGGTSEVAAQLLSRVQGLEEQVRQLRGRIDETQNLISRQNAELSKRIDDLTFQLNLQGNRGGGSSSSGSAVPPPVREVAPRPPQTADATPRPDFTPRLPLPSVIPPPPQPPQSFTFNQSPEPMRETPVPSRVDPVRPPPRPADVALRPPPPPPEDIAPPPPEPVAAAIPGGKRTPELALQEGHAALARRDYTGAERAAREVVSNRTSPRAYDGQFLLAQTLAGEKQYAQAAIAFDDTYNRSHKGRYAEEALVGLAGALTSINEKKAACDTLGRLRVEFPQVRADLRDTITKTNQRAGCAG
jgi:TolA-binding protein